MKSPNAMERIPVDWNLLIGSRCDFSRPSFVNPGLERGTIKGTNSAQGILENVIITDAAGNEVFVPTGIALQCIVLLADES